MRNCPFCNEEIQVDHPLYGIKHNDERDTYSLHHFCHPLSEELEVCVSVYGKTEEEVIKRWNGDEEQTSESL